MLTNIPDRIHLKFLGSTYVTLKIFVEKCLGVYQETFLGWSHYLRPWFKQPQELFLVSSIVNWGYQDNFECVYYYFFYKKILSVKKHKQTLANKTKNKPAKNKGSVFLRTQASKRVKVAWFAFCAFFTHGIFLKKKKKNRLKIDLIASIQYTTDAYPYQPAYKASIYTHLFIFVIICENFFFLWQSFSMNLFLFVIVCENPFFLWESLWVFLICENLFFYKNSFYPWESLLSYGNSSFLW